MTRFLQKLATWLDRTPSQRRRRRGVRGERTVEPARQLAEQLEERLLLATIVWDGEAGDNNWNTPANWFDQTNNQNDVLPGSSDDAVIGTGFNTVISSSSQSVRSVTLDSSLTIDGGAFTVTDDSVFNATVTVTGAGSLSLDTLTVNGTGALVNQSQVTLGGATVSTSVTNDSGATLLVRGPSNGQSSTLDGSLTTTANSTLRIKGTAATNFNAVLNVTGFVNNGTIELTNDGNSRSAALIVTSGTLENAGTIAALAGDGGGSRTITGNVTNYVGATPGVIDVDRSLNINVNVTGNKVFDSRLGTLDLAAGTSLVATGSTGATTQGKTILGSGTVFAGAGTLNLAGGSSTYRHLLELPSDLTVVSGAGLVFGGFVGVSGPGVINNSATLVLDGDVIDATSGLNNLSGGVVIVRPGSGGHASTIGGSITTAANSTIRVEGTVATNFNAVLNVAGFVNNGTIELTNDGNSRSAALIVTSGTLENAGTIAALAGDGGGSRTITGNVTNYVGATPGVIDVDRSLNINVNVAGNKVLDSRLGTLDLAAGTSLAVTSSTGATTQGKTILGSGTMVAGTGTLNLAGGSSTRRHLLELPSDLTVASGVGLVFGGFVGVSGPGVINNSAILVLDGDVIDATSGLNNLSGGVVIARPGSGAQENTIDGPITTAANSTLRVEGTAATNFSAVVNVTGFVNNGTIELTNDGNSRSAALIVTSGTLENAGTIHSMVADGGGSRTISADITNTGTIQSNYPLQLTKSGGTHTNSGVIDIPAGSSLNLTNSGALTQTAGTTTVNGTLNVSPPLALQGGILQGDGTVATDVTQSGGGVAPGNSPGLLTLNGDLNQTAGSIDIEVGGLNAGTQHDIIQVNGTVALATDLNVALMNGYEPSPGDQFLILANDGVDAISGMFTGLTEGSRFVVDTSIFEISYVGTTVGADGNDIVLTAIASDLGDAPDSYGTLKASSGAQHGLSAGLYLGTVAPDADTDGFGDGTENNVNLATDDDTEGTAPDDENAISADIIVPPNETTYSLTVSHTNSTGASANLVGWIDFDGSGAFESDEAATAAVSNGSTSTVLTWTGIGTTGPDVNVGEFFARFRLTSDAIDATMAAGAVTDGEVEDYQARICVDACWDGGPAGTGADWNVPANWVGDVLPGSTNDVYIGPGYTGITSSQNNSIRSLLSFSPVTISAGSFTLNQDSVIGAALNVSGTGLLTLATMTLSGAGTLTNSATVRSNNGVVDTTFANQGLLEARLNSNQVNGTLTTDQNSIIRMGGTGGGTGEITFANGFENNGLVELTTLGFGFDSAITISTGTLINKGTILTEVNDGGSRRITGAVDNQGTMTINQNTLIVNNGVQLDLTGSNLSVASGKTLTIQNGETVINSATSLSGNGAINLTGTSALTLATDVVLPSGGPGWQFDGTVTVGPSGRVLTNQTSLTLTADTINADVSNDGTLRVAGPNSQLNGSLATTANSNIKIGATGGGPGRLTLNSGFTNNGAIELTELGFAGFDAILDVTNGVLLNAGTITTLGTAGPRTILADVTNQGTISASLRPLTVNGAVLDSRSGSLHVESGQSLTRNAGQTIIGAGTLSGSGQIILNQTHTLLLDSDVTIPAGGPSLNFAGTVTVSPSGKTLTNQSTITLTGDIVNADVVNEGVLKAAGPNNRLNGTFSTAAGSGLEIGATGGGSGYLLVQNGFENNGTIRLTELGFSGFDAILDVPSGIVVNKGIIETHGNSGPRTVRAIIDNQGSIIVDALSLKLDASNAAHTSSSSVSISSGRNLNVTNGGTWTQTNGTATVLGTLQSAQPVMLQGGRLEGTGSISGGVTQSGGTMAPGASTGALAISGALQHSSSTASTEIEIGPTDSQFDSVSVTGDVSLSGPLQIVSVGGYQPPIGTTFLILNKQSTGAITGTFDGLPEGAILVGGGSLYQISYQAGGGNDVVLTVVPGDFGDAPSAAQSGFGASYPVLLSDNGARHGDQGPTLGTLRDIENDGVHSADADGDDAAGSDDEDGVVLVATSLIVSDTASTTGQVQIDLQNADSAANRLDAWIDFNQDGDWNDAGEQIFASEELGIVNGTQLLNFTIPQDTGANVLTGQTFGRFRLSTVGGLSPTGAAVDGEVEDLPLSLLPGISLTQTMQTVNENVGTADVVFQLTTTPDEPVTVQYSLGGSATAGATADYTADAGPLVIPAGSSAGTLTASIRDDSTVELTETVVLTIDSVAGARLSGGAQHTLSITDNDAAVFTIDDVQIAENGTAQFTVSLDQPIDTPVVVDVSFGDVTATGGNVDYDDTATTVTFAADSTISQSFSVAINDDNLVELSETLTVSLSTQTSLGTRDVTLTDTATGTITDNDAAAFAIGDVTVDEDGTATFVVSLDQPIDIGVAVDVSFADVSASGGNIDYDSATQTVTFAAGSTQSQSVTVAVNDDDLVELSEETFSVSLSTATSLGTRNVSLSDTATGTISDNDAATITVDDITVSEDGAAVLTIRLDQPIDTDVVVDINYTDGTATGGQVDYDSTATQVTFSAGSNSDQTVSISLNDDSLVELTENFTAALTTSTSLGTRDVIVNDSASVTVNDDDAAVFTIDDVTAAENGTMVLTVSLDHPIDTAVQVDIAFTDGSATGGDVDYDSGTQSVQFAAGTTTAQTITVALNDDDLVESNESFTATLSTQTTAGTRDVTVNDSAVATITDNDVATDFGDAPAGYPVRLSEDGARHVAVGPTLGATRDAETDGTPSAAADADGADEDGVQFTQPLQVGMPAEFTVDVSDNGFINAWADWNLDGDFEDAGEQIFSNFAVTTGSNTLQTTLPADASPGLTVLRYRLTSASVNVPSPAGILPDGEVEDYVSLVELMRPRINFDSGATEDQVPVFDWDDVPGAAKYHVWLSRLTGTAAPLYQVTTTESDWMPPQPIPIGQYRIWIQAETDQGALSDWSAPVTFDVNTRVLLQIPERYQTTQRPTISWDALEGAVAYDLWVDSVSDGTSQFVRESNLTSTSFTPNTDWSLGRYRYWVRGIDEDGRPARWARFEELVVATAPQVIGPVGGIFDMTPTFTWTTVSGAATYELLLRDRLLRTDRIVDGITSTDWTPATDLEGGPWTWHVLAVAQDNARGLWSPPSDIYVGGRTTVTSPTGTTGDTTPTFTWTEVQGAVRYDLWVDKVGGPGQIIREQNLTSTSFTPATPLEAGDYRVWVQAISSEGTESPWSLEVNFTIAANEKFLGDELDQSIVTALSEQTWHVDEKSRATHIPAAAQRRVEYDSPGQARVSEAATATTEFASYVPERVVEQSPEEVIDVVADEVFSMWSERSLNDV